MGEEKIKMDYRRYIESSKGPCPITSYDDYSVFPLSMISIKFDQFLNGKINDLNIDVEDLNILKKYVNDNKRKPLENLLAASFILYNADVNINRKRIYEIFKKSPRIVSKYHKKFNSSKILYENIGAQPRINSNVVEYDFLKRKEK